MNDMCETCLRILNLGKVEEGVVVDQEYKYHGPRRLGNWSTIETATGQIQVYDRPGLMIGQFNGILRIGDKVLIGRRIGGWAKQERE